VVLKPDFLHNQPPFCQNQYLADSETSLLPKNTNTNMACSCGLQPTIGEGKNLQVFCLIIKTQTQSPELADTIKITYLLTLRHVLTLSCNGCRHCGLFTFQDSNIYRTTFTKASIKMHITVKNFPQPVVYFQNRLQLLQMVTSLLVAV